VVDGKITFIEATIPTVDASTPGNAVRLDSTAITSAGLSNIASEKEITPKSLQDLKDAHLGLPAETVKIFGSFGKVVDDIDLAKGTICGIAVFPFLARAAGLVLAPELLELAAIAVSLEALGAIGVSMASPQLAKLALDLLKTFTDSYLEEREDWAKKNF
jgi:hypothetical protein